MTDSAAENAPPLDDPAALARFGRLDVVARLIVEGYMMGQHKSPFKGSSVEFVEHRQYYPGDEIRHIDWRAYGKTGKYYVKEFEDETNLRCYLLLDASGSMGYGQSTLTKFEYARQMAAALAYLLMRQRDAVGLCLFDRKMRTMLEPSTNATQFPRLIDALQTATPGRETSLSRVFEDILPRLKRRSLIVLLSDLFDRIEPLQTALKRFRHYHHEVVVLQTIAPEEEEFPFSRPTQFENLERENNRLLVDPHRLRKHYLEQYQQFDEQLERVCRKTGVDRVKVSTSQPFAETLGRYLAYRSRGR
ncbi:MAG: DUF58 domain-containing protein [Planctomyces sp.]|uniref:DUF58 domain-containing protein n=1 Tax=Rubinisphaera brasiliensis (strain ATCC 49424 / DSM 5305 / JCM 21570 / IAM 15109 / NBRC 103401 / IFAM 1448) TaxID=756272 RepID=F0SQ07_RUBBR|nr:DUF58 domain-containing protein [Rubinisphaera brasiliensis]ADY60157.1 protein of unknown function DUF58 [Rubinisphaera brasiliensis DSM 5305]MBB03556.1 DUF58 domain-containing protein [Planctomyces sp.]